MNIAPAKDAQAYRLIYHPAQHDGDIDTSGTQSRMAHLEDLATQLYNSVGSRQPIMRVHGASDGPFHAIEMIDAQGATRHVLFFQIHAMSARVANLFLDIEGYFVNFFSDYVFKTWPKVNIIRFENCNRIESGSTRYAFQNDGATTFIRSLPDNFDVFIKSLGKDTIRNHRRYMEKAKRDIGLRIEIIEKDALDRATFDAAMKLKNTQLQRLGMFALPDDYIDALFLAHQQFGLTVVLYSGDRLIAFYMTTIAYKGCECWTTAYDPAFSKYWLGNLSVLEAVRAAIGKKCDRANFMWGRSDQKEILGAKPEALKNLIVAKHGAAYIAGVISIGLYQPAKAFMIRAIRFLIRKVLTRVKKSRTAETPR